MNPTPTALRCHKPQPLGRGWLHLSASMEGYVPVQFSPEGAPTAGILVKPQQEPSRDVAMLLPPQSQGHFACAGQAEAHRRTSPSARGHMDPQWCRRRRLGMPSRTCSTAPCTPRSSRSCRPRPRAGLICGPTLMPRLRDAPHYLDHYLIDGINDFDNCPRPIALRSTSRGYPRKIVRWTNLRGRKRAAQSRSTARSSSTFPRTARQGSALGASGGDCRRGCRCDRQRARHRCRSHAGSGRGPRGVDRGRRDPPSGQEPRPQTSLISRHQRGQPVRAETVSDDSASSPPFTR